MCRNAEPVSRLLALQLSSVIRKRAGLSEGQNFWFAPQGGLLPFAFLLFTLSEVITKERSEFQQKMDRALNPVKRETGQAAQRSTLEIAERKRSAV
jgi:hypothetical protein